MKNLQYEPLAVEFAFGFVTYMWGAQWDLPTLLQNCSESRALGVELRTTHKHGVEPNLNAKERAIVRKRFADSPVTLVGIGSNERFDNPDPKIVRKAIEKTKEFIRLSHDVGGSGVKVKPDRFHDGVPREKTIEQIGKALNELGKYGLGFGQQIRLEVHGGCAALPVIADILEVADETGVAVCWNCNKQDLAGDGLNHNFDLIKGRLGDTLHIHDLRRDKAYPYAELAKLLVRANYGGWVMLEEGEMPKGKNVVKALAEQGRLWDDHVRKALVSR